MQQTSKAANLYRVETARRSVVLSMIGGEQLRGWVFIHSSSQRPFELEDITELFNSAEEFFPLELETEEVILVSKARVAEITDAGGSDTGDQPQTGTPAPTALLQLVLIGGDVRVGSIRLEARPDRARVLDYLNRLNARFLTLYTSNEARLINRSLIDRVRPLD
jgi:hypothetical protein